MLQVFLKNSSQNSIGQKKFKIAQKHTACIANSNCRNHDPRGQSMATMGEGSSFYIENNGVKSLKKSSLEDSRPKKLYLDLKYPQVVYILKRSYGVGLVHNQWSHFYTEIHGENVKNSSFQNHRARKAANCVETPLGNVA